MGAHDSTVRGGAAHETLVPHSSKGLIARGPRTHSFLTSAQALGAGAGWLYIGGLFQSVLGRGQAGYFMAARSPRGEVGSGAVAERQSLRGFEANRARSVLVTGCPLVLPRRQPSASAPRKN